MGEGSKLLVVTGSRVERAADADAASVGQKASGLFKLPEVWTPQFFVVSASALPTPEAILEAGRICSLGAEDRVLVRSSGTLEGMNQRGALDSFECILSEVADTIRRAQSEYSRTGRAGEQDVHFLVQRNLQTIAKGHLSNERRLSRHSRDWVMEIEASSGLAGETHPVAVRRWRDAAEPQVEALACTNRTLIASSLQQLAKWGVRQGGRLHFEWVWDGTQIWAVQVDACLDRTDGVEPKALVAGAKKLPTIDGLEKFRVAEPADFERYRKLRNVSIYRSLGYEMPPFFVMSDQTEISTIRSGGTPSAGLTADLSQLCAAPFVLRTDAVGIPSRQRQMLSRSDELRSAETALEWLTGRFVHDISELPASTELALIGHHFVPATASAWSLAYPNKRRVRIESLWGIPEGLYWYAHDVYDVDTAEQEVDRIQLDHCVVLAKRERFKDRFVAPDERGNWIVHHTTAGPDWQGSITRTDWIKEISLTSRRIASAEGTPVVVMWFIDVSRSASKHRVLPWYHETWKTTSAPTNASPRKKRTTSSERVVSTRVDWESIKTDVAAGERLERVAILPDEGDIVRERPFLEELAQHAKHHGYVVELRGGLLSHAFYLLSEAGCAVECVDLFAIEEEEIQFNKLVRDRVPEEIEGRGENVELVKLKGDALIEALRRKLVEEALEAADAKSSAAVVEELADLQEVISAIRAALNIDAEEVSRAQTRKRGKRGGFADGLMLLRTSLDSSVSTPALLPALDSREPQVVSSASDVPASPQDEFHIDQRADVAGTLERQFTISLPVAAASFRSGRHTFGLATPAGAAHEMQFEANVERHGADLKLKVRLINSVLQLSLPLNEGGRDSLKDGDVK